MKGSAGLTSRQSTSARCRHGVIGMTESGREMTSRGHALLRHPAKAGIWFFSLVKAKSWIPAFAGMTRS
jgi:hypothetical protein